MTIILYYLSFLPLLLLTLTVHELGHLAAARFLHVRASGFQIGFGRRLLAFHSGRTTVLLTPETILLDPAQNRPQPGELAVIYVTGQPGDDRYTATALIPKSRRLSPTGGSNSLAYQNENHMQLRGLVREITDGHIVLTSMTWSLHAIPFAAGVFLPEDPSHRISHVYNTTSWARQMAIILAGPMANLALMAVILFTLAAFPITQVNSPTLIVDSVAPGSPADQAGIQPGDQLVQVGTTLMPSGPELRQAIQQAGADNGTLRLKVFRRQATLNIGVTPNPLTAQIGVSINHVPRPSQPYSMAPRAMGQRLNNLGHAYFDSIASILPAFRENPARPADISGPVLGAHHTAQAVQHAGLKAWLAILGALTLSIALLNLLPIPPLDGYRLVTQTIQAARHGRPISPKVDRAMTFSGLAIFYLTALYFVMSDILHLME